MATWANEVAGSTERDFPVWGGPSERLRFLLQWAVLAPSRHNTLPGWQSPCRRSVANAPARDQASSISSIKRFAVASKSSSIDAGSHCAFSRPRHSQANPGVVINGKGLHSSIFF